MVYDNHELARHYNLDEIEAELKALRTDLVKITATRKRLKRSVLTYSQYLELFEDIFVILRKTHDMTILDETLQKFFSNFIFKTSGIGKQQRSEATLKLKELWDGFLKSDNFVRGRGERTRTFGLRVPNAAR